MSKNILKLILIFVFGIFGGIFADQILWPYFIERPLFYKYRLDQAPIVMNKTEEIIIEENSALEKAIEKVEKSVVGIRIETEAGKVIEGSGLVITSDGLIITLSDLISPKGNDTTLFFDGEAFGFRVLKRDAQNNLALIKIEKNSLPTIGFAEFGSLRFGQRVFLVGAFFRNGIFTKMVNEGIIKSYDEKSVITNMTEKSYIKGSPLFNIKGELVGLNNIDSENKVVSISISKIREFVGF